MNPLPVQLPGFENDPAWGADIVYTPPTVAAEIVQHFNPQGTKLDPCRGTGAFTDAMPDCEWCEIRVGKDFFAWNKHVDWIISNPPYSIFADFMRHSFTVADNIVYLIPIQKVYVSKRMMDMVWAWGGIPEIYVIGEGHVLNWDMGFCIGAVHFKKGYTGGTHMTFRK